MNVFSFFKRRLARSQTVKEADTVTPAEYQFEMVLTAADLLNDFAREISRMIPPNVPANMPSVRGWTIRFTTLQDYGSQIPAGELRALARGLNGPIEALDNYVRRWDTIVLARDPLLRSYHVLPGDEDTVDGVRVLLNRAVQAQHVALHLVASQTQSRLSL
jgi:hypothetical protein